MLRWVLRFGKPKAVQNVQQPSPDIQSRRTARNLPVLQGAPGEVNQVR